MVIRTYQKWSYFLVIAFIDEMDIRNFCENLFQIGKLWDMEYLLLEVSLTFSIIFYVGLGKLYCGLDWSIYYFYILGCEIDVECAGMRVLVLLKLVQLLIIATIPCIFLNIYTNCTFLSNGKFYNNKFLPLLLLLLLSKCSVFDIPLNFCNFNINLLLLLLPK